MMVEERISKIRDYAITVFCITGTIAILLFILMYIGLLGMLSSSWSSARGSEPIGFWASCSGDTANVYINANQDVKNVKCTALDAEFVSKKEVVIGDLKIRDNDVCSFNLLKNATQPLRFEIGYNDKTERIVCNWRPATAID